MAVEQIVVVCDDPRHARGKVATIERFEREQGRWAARRAESRGPAYQEPDKGSGGKPPAVAQTKNGDPGSWGDYDGLYEEAAELAPQLRYRCNLCGLDLDVRRSVLSAVLDPLAAAGVSHVSLAGLIAVVSKAI